ncbi:VanZ family protein [Phytoactinopolyspora halotolerans]|uniref:VanZ family protein n=1 Tax=Phytoactinopolyspora halotolerans TaxID=1981512 RepID=A0A6L9SH39_9ACTN|nr:VanZ family protein [Phytoactinopolyspora halotolerans]NEE03954.1 VanZ family protein [Phytoactinopolyspora halotolerans]
MISTVLVEHPWMTTVGLVALVVLGPVVGAWLMPRPQIARVLLALSILAVALLAFVPTGRELAVGCTMEWSVPTLGAVELMGNVILFVPVVLLAGVVTRRPLVMLLAASGASVLVEAVQAFATVLGRSCSSNDWLANTLGACLGAVLAVIALRLARSGRHRHPV